MLNDSPLKLSPILGESFKLSPKIGESLRLSPNPWLSPSLGDPLLNAVSSKWQTLLCTKLIQWKSSAPQGGLPADCCVALAESSNFSENPLTLNHCPRSNDTEDTQTMEQNTGAATQAKQIPKWKSAFGNDGCLRWVDDPQLCNSSRRQRARLWSSIWHPLSCVCVLWLKLSNALKHLNIFLAGCYKKINCASFVDCCHPAHCGVKTSGTFEEANMWWDNMIGNFFSCLDKDACKCGDLDKLKAESRMKQQQVAHQASRFATSTSFATKVQSQTCLVQQNGESCATTCLCNSKRKQKAQESHWLMVIKPQRMRIAMQSQTVVIGLALWKPQSSSTSTTQCCNAAAEVQKCPCWRRTTSKHRMSTSCVTPTRSWRLDKRMAPVNQFPSVHTVILSTRMFAFPSCASLQWIQCWACQSTSFPSLLAKSQTPIQKGKSRARCQHSGPNASMICQRCSKR